MERKQKADSVTIKSISVIDMDRKGPVVFGIGGDQKVYIWVMLTATWELYAPAEEKI